MSEQRESGRQCSLSLESKSRNLVVISESGHSSKDSETIDVKMKTNPQSNVIKLTKRDKALGRRLVNSLCKQFLEEGIVDPDGKTDEQVLRELFDHAVKWSKQHPMLMSTDHKSSLLKQAREFAKQEDFEEAFLFYATWFEHWINGVLTRRQNKLDENRRRQMLRETSLKGKFTWLLPLIHQAEIPSRYVDAIIRISEIRNSFVHYKFILSDVDKRDEEEARHLADLARAEKAIKFLKRLEAKIFLSKQARKLIRKLEARDKTEKQINTPNAKSFC
jgi:hypothetical protein